MKIQILGTGCPKCRMLFANAVEAVHASGIQAQVEKVENITDIIAFGVMTTPALAIDGRIKSAGKVLDAGTIKTLLRTGEPASKQPDRT